MSQLANCAAPNEAWRVQPFAEACVASPIGAALLARLEQQQRRDYASIFDDPTANPQRVDQAVARVFNMSFGELCREVLEASEDVGPWTSGAEMHAWATYRHVADRLPIADAIDKRFAGDLHAPIALEDQEWWLHSSGGAGKAPLFGQLDDVYENGELSWRALRAYGPTPIEVFARGFGEAPPPSTRWSLPVVRPAQVFEIHRPDDWYQLCVSYPRAATAIHGTWALPGPNAGGYRPLLRLENQHAATGNIDVHLCPKWSLVARDYDAVHLSWAGFITAEGHVLTRGPNTSMLRYWDREVTMWLKDCFGIPSPLPLPPECDDHLIDPMDSPARLTQDREVISAMLAR